MFYLSTYTEYLYLKWYISIKDLTDYAVFQLDKYLIQLIPLTTTEI